MRRPRVYVAGPINGSGRQFDNLRRAIHAGNQLMGYDIDPFIPHLNLMCSFLASDDSDTNVPRWQEWDDAWLGCCHALLRLPGSSPGSDHEVALAERLGLPVFYSIPSLVAWARHRFEAA
jgi:hypothetical protein